MEWYTGTNPQIIACSEIDFKDAKYLKLRPVDDREKSFYRELLIDGEQVLQAFQSIRYMVVFTSKRIIAINVQGIIGKKRDFTLLPYSKIQAFSVETAGTFVLGAELEIWISDLGQVKFDFAKSCDIKNYSKIHRRKNFIIWGEKVCHL